MGNFVKVYLVAFIVFMVTEGIWLSLVAKNFYKKEIGYLMAKSPKLLPTIFFSFIFVFGLVFFAINPALVKDSWSYALYSGSILGLVSYGTYDLTNHAAVKDWPLKVTIVDLFWGVFMSGTVAGITFFIVSMIF